MVLVRQVISMSNPLFAQILTCHELHLMQRLNQIVIIGFYIKHFNWESGIFKQDLPRKFYLFQEISHFLAIWVQFDCMKKFNPHSISIPKVFRIGPNPKVVGSNRIHIYVYQWIFWWGGFFIEIFVSCQFCMLLTFFFSNFTTDFRIIFGFASFSTPL